MFHVTASIKPTILVRFIFNLNGSISISTDHDKVHSEREQQRTQIRGVRYARFCAGKAGWRKTMEDSKIHRINLPGGISVFGVFDGHGGMMAA
jgi:serine/threonine protein phosphatase PrpC